MTLTAVLHGITFVSLSYQLDAGKAASIIGESLLNLRHFIKHDPIGYPRLEPRELIGDYVTEMRHVFDISLIHKARELVRGVGK